MNFGRASTIKRVAILTVMSVAKMKRSTSIRVLRYSARTVLVVVALLWFGFAVLSGAENGVGGLLENLSNALPWLLLFAIVYIVFRWELLGGVLAMVTSVASILFFNTWTVPVVLIGVSLPIMAAGVALIICYFLDRGDYDS